ncbi:HAD family hydrolase [Vibrio palustris]|uniref:Pyrimidine 5'-nucleotidase YjjG n=1 Tax=Vibrio palustris TaxID=1918946 RepID=A0A1R4B5E0_9VIBR|nr:HAD family hydrolase [Vibrio palustris]SJL84101.1 Pyrimidine 5'-nucleotidase YjjG [Vibrio palustris]
MTKIQAVMFDLGNTLTTDISLTDGLTSIEGSSICDDLELDIKQLNALGDEIDRCIAKLYTNNNTNQPHWLDIWQQASISIGLNFSSYEIERLCRAHLKAFVRGCTVKPYSIPLLKYLKDRQIPLCLVSNMTGPVDVFDEGLREKGLAKFFDAVVWSSEISFRKPNAKIFELALKKLNVEASKDIWMVGDRERADIIGGQALGLTTVRVIANQQDKNSSADYVVDGSNILEFFYSS